MHRIDFTPVFRSTIGFDRMARLVDAAFQASEGSNSQSYPPYNIEKLTEDKKVLPKDLGGKSTTKQITKVMIDILSGKNN